MERNTATAAVVGSLIVAAVVLAQVVTRPETEAIRSPSDLEVTQAEAYETVPEMREVYTGPVQVAYVDIVLNDGTIVTRKMTSFRSDSATSPSLFSEQVTGRSRRELKRGHYQDSETGKYYKQQRAAPEDEGTTESVRGGT